jgi:hypothetical protein
MPPVRDRLEYERRWLLAGKCAVCGQPRAQKTGRSRRGSTRFCRKHLEMNREYQARYRASRRAQRAAGAKFGEDRGINS